MVGDVFSHLGGQAIYWVIEGAAWLFRRPTARHEANVARRAAHNYWRARALRRQKRTPEAFLTAKAAYAILHEADRQATFSEMSMIVMLLDRLATEASVPDGARAELIDALLVISGIHADPSRRSKGLDQLLSWLQFRVHSIKG